MLAIVPSSAGDRAHRREVERRHRKRRQAKLEAMRETLAALERAVPVVLTLDGSDETQWEGFLDKDALRVRELMKDTMQLMREARELQASSAQLNRLLAEHRLAVRVISELPSKPIAGDWEYDVRRWRMLVIQHFEPWSIAGCLAEIKAGQAEMAGFHWSTDKETSGVSVFGWRDVRRFDRQQGVLQFRFKKTFRGFDMGRYANSMWNVYTDADTYQAVVAGPHVRGYHHVVQQLGPDLAIIHGGLRYPENPVDMHITFIVFRTKSEKGFALHARSVRCPELTAVISGHSNLWFDHSISFYWNRLKTDENGFVLRVEGSFGGGTVSYVDGWMQMVLECTLRCEIAGTGRQLITST